MNGKNIIISIYMSVVCIVVISSMSAIILGQLAQQIYQRYYRRDKMVILAEFDPNMEMGPLI